VTVAWRPLARGETDHELLWGLVGLATAAVALAAWASGAPGLPPCVFKGLTGVPCITCGSTRALAALVAGDLGAALRWNPLAVLGAAALSVYVPYGAATGLLGSRRVRLALHARDRRLLRLGVLFVVAIAWAFLITDGR
jgi:hypothetical protein